MDASEDDVDDDFADIFDDFNNDSEVAPIAEQISSNLRAHLGLRERAVHEGESDEGRILWVAPKFSGLANSTATTQKAIGAYSLEEAEDELWGELAPEDGDTIQLSQNLRSDWDLKKEAATQALEMMGTEEAERAAECFDRLAAAGRGYVVIDVQEFQELLMKLSQDPGGRKLLELLLVKPRAQATQRKAV